MVNKIKVKKNIQSENSPNYWDSLRYLQSNHRLEEYMMITPGKKRRQSGRITGRDFINQNKLSYTFTKQSKYVKMNSILEIFLKWR